MTFSFFFLHSVFNTVLIKLCVGQMSVPMCFLCIPGVKQCLSELRVFPLVIEVVEQRRPSQNINITY